MLCVYNKNYKSQQKAIVEKFSMVVVSEVYGARSGQEVSGKEHEELLGNGSVIF